MRRGDRSPRPGRLLLAQGRREELFGLRARIPSSGQAECARPPRLFFPARRGVRRGLRRHLMISALAGLAALLVWEGFNERESDSGNMGKLPWRAKRAPCACGADANGRDADADRGM